MEKQQDVALYDCYCDLGKTGTDFDRPAFRHLLQDIYMKRVNCVMVKDFSRFGRDYIETGNYIQKVFPAQGVRFISVTDDFDSLLCEKDELGMHLKNLSNEMYARDVGLKVKTAKKIKKESGSYTGGVPPYGYLIKQLAEKRCLVWEEEAAEVVKTIYRLFDEGDNIRTISEWLFKEEIHRPTEYRHYGHVYKDEGEELYQWSRETVRAVLTHSVYAEKGVRSKGRGDEGVQACRSEPIIEIKQFDRVQGKIKRKKAACEKKVPVGKTRDATAKSEPDVFSNLIYCGECKRKMQRSGDGYVCRNASRIDTLRCEKKYISKKELEEIICAYVKTQFAVNPAEQEKILQKCRICGVQRQQEIQKRQKQILKKLDWEQRMENRYYQEYRAGALTGEAFLVQKEERERQKELLQTALESESRKEKELKQRILSQEQFWQELFFGEGRMLLNRRLVEALLGKIYVYPGRKMEILCR